MNLEIDINTAENNLLMFNSLTCCWTVLLAISFDAIMVKKDIAVRQHFAAADYNIFPSHAKQFKKI